MASLLPFPLQDPRGKGFEAALNLAMTVDTAIVHPMDVAHAPSAALPVLAVQFGVLGPLWNAQATDGAKRTLLLQAIVTWAKSGTKASLSSVLALAGFASCTILDVNDGLRYNGVANFDGTWDYGSSVGAWYMYRVVVPRTSGQGYSAANHAALQAIVATFAPARSILERVQLTLTPVGTLAGLPVANDLANVAISNDGATWTSRANLGYAINAGAHTATVTGKLYVGDGAGLNVLYVGVLNNVGAVTKSVAVPLIVKDTNVEIDLSWSLTW